jgi:hypothetical protein
MRAVALLIPTLLAAAPAAAQVPPTPEEQRRMAAEMIGMPVESLVIYGFDRRHGKYTVVGSTPSAPTT